MSNKLRIFTDGAYKDGKIAYAFGSLRKRTFHHTDSGVLQIENPDMLKTGSQIAELAAIRAAVVWAKSQHCDHLVIVTDSQVAEDVLTGTGNTSKYFMRSIITEIKALLADMKFTITWVNRNNANLRVIHNLASKTLKADSTNSI